MERRDEIVGVLFFGLLLVAVASCTPTATEFSDDFPDDLSLVSLRKRIYFSWIRQVALMRLWEIPLPEKR